MICPCKDCEKKGCGTFHDQCEEYIKYTKWRKSVNDIERKEKAKLFLGVNAKRSHRTKKNIWH